MNEPVRKASLKINGVIFLYGVATLGLVAWMALKLPKLGLSDVKDIALVITPIVTLYLTAFNIRHSNDLQAATRTAEAAQAWLEKTFLVEGIEPVVHYMSAMSRITDPRARSNFVEPPFPTAALTRMTLLFRHDRLLPLALIFAEDFRYLSTKDNSKDPAEMLRIMKAHQIVTETLLELEGILLMCEISTKKEIILLHKVPEIKEISERIKDTFEEMFAEQVKRSKKK